MKTKAKDIEAGLINTLRRFAAEDGTLRMGALLDDVSEDITVGDAIRFLYMREEAEPNEIDERVLGMIHGGHPHNRTERIVSQIAFSRNIGRHRTTEYNAVASEIRRSLNRLRSKGLIYRNEAAHTWRVTEVGEGVWREQYRRRHAERYGATHATG